VTETPLPRRAQFFLLGLLTTLFYINFLSRIFMAPLMPVIEQDLGLAHTGAGGFFMLLAIGYATGLRTGFLSSRMNYRQNDRPVLRGVGCSFSSSLERPGGGDHGRPAPLGIASGLFLRPG
jgi:NNP family nitrate/nitrite transporter-like MFS transporter